MFGTSLRFRVLVLGGLAAAVIVMTALAGTYLVVVVGMGNVARTETERLSVRAGVELRDALVKADYEGRERGRTGAEATAAAQASFVRTLPQRFGAIQGFPEGRFAFWRDDSAFPYYSSSTDRPIDEPAARASAISSGRRVLTHTGGHPLLADLFAAPDLGIHVAHIPFTEPDGRRDVMEVAYVAQDESAALALIRPPMLALSAASVLITILVLLWMTSRVLMQVEELRVAADLVDAGRLDVTLPATRRDEIGDLARSLNQLIDRLRRRADLQTRFVADASHELATPVAGIRGYVGILRGWGAEDAAVREEALDAIDRESRRMVRLTGQLLALIRGEAEQPRAAIRHDVNELCRRIVSGMAMRYADKELDIQGPASVELPLMADPDRVEDLISILVDNAAKYTPAGGRVSLDTSLQAGWIAIAVCDTGPGIAAQDLEHIFDRFYRSDASRAQSTGGFGLGLAIAKGMAASMGGGIGVVSTPGDGTTFTVRLPQGSV